MALTAYDQYILSQMRRGENPKSVAELLPGNLGLLGGRFLRERGIDPAQQNLGPSSATTEPSGAERARIKPPKFYDPNWFRPQGNAPATPSANAAVAAQSQVVRTPQELQAQYEKQQDAISAESSANTDLQKMWNAYKNGFGNLSTAIQGELGGRMRAMPAGAPLNEGITLSPGSTGYYRPDVTNGSGQSYVGIPEEYTPRWPSARPFDISGTLRTPTLNRNYAGELAGMIRSQMQDGGPIVPKPVVGNAAVPSNQALWDRPGVNDALTSWVNAYQGLQNVQKDYLGRPVGMQSGGSAAGESKALTDSWNTYQQQYNQNRVTEGNAYLDQMGGGFYGGVVPSANNPQWYDTTPTWGAPTREIGQRKGMEQAQNSPWGQPGAPWESQAWAAGTYNPSKGPQPAGQNGDIQDPQRWNGSWGMFAPQQGFNPQLAVNAPWQAPKQQNNAFGATSTPGMTFGASPWGSFW